MLQNSSHSTLGLIFRGPGKSQGRLEERFSIPAQSTDPELSNDEDDSSLIPIMILFMMNFIMSSTNSVLT